MKRAVSISIGSSKRDKAVEITLLGERVRIERIGTDGDMKKAAALYTEMDGKVDAFGVGGADLGLLLQLVEPQLQMHLLDVATGAGHTAMALAPYVAGVTAIDLTPEMIRRTEELAASRGLRNITARVMDVEALQFPDAVFDAVTCRIAAHHFLDCQKAVREMARVLKPGGRMVIEDNSVPEDPELDRFLNTVERIRDATHLRSYNEAEWRQMLAAAGLEVRHSRVHRVPHEIAGWLDRAGMDAAGKERVYAALAAASPAARRHFEIIGEADRPTFFSDDKLILLAVKR